MDENYITELYIADPYLYELHLDHSAQVLYWANSNTQIWTMDIDGSNPRVLLQLLNSFYFFTQWNNLVYWTDYSGIHSITKDGSSNTTIVKLDETCYYYYHEYYDIAIISGNKQQPGNLDLKNLLMLSPLFNSPLQHLLVNLYDTDPQDSLQDVVLIHSLPPQAPIPVVMIMVAAINSVSWVQWIPGDTPVQMKVPEAWTCLPWQQFKPGIVRLLIFHKFLRCTRSSSSATWRYVWM